LAITTPILVLKKKVPSSYETGELENSGKGRNKTKQKPKVLLYTQKKP
jgi:hypothetical protein